LAKVLLAQLHDNEELSNFKMPGFHRQDCLAPVSRLTVISLWYTRPKPIGSWV
jgi:hypothetical protein